MIPNLGPRFQIVFCDLAYFLKQSRSHMKCLETTLHMSSPVFSNIHIFGNAAKMMPEVEDGRRAVRPLHTQKKANWRRLVRSRRRASLVLLLKFLLRSASLFLEPTSNQFDPTVYWKQKLRVEITEKQPGSRHMLSGPHLFQHVDDNAGS